MKLKNTYQILIPILMIATFFGNCYRFRIGKQYKPQPTLSIEGKVALIHENHAVKKYGYIDEKIFLTEFENELKEVKGLEIVSFRESRKKIQEMKLDPELVKINLHDPIAIKANPALLAKLSESLGTNYAIVIYSDEGAFPLLDTLMVFSSGAFISNTMGNGRGIFHSASVIQLKSSELLFQEFVSSEDSPVRGPARGRKLASVLVNGLISAKAAN
ncbi:hypothetical protein A0128_11690 [Leptospira tipperaryensis]|uniref:Uncharacterized protein n=1 Tax=Leptospira tipperaryensis TaxID=2564040 RepID=A0A1D7UXZ9_9LEPT|nr:hypothetical protein [Leptospira tipperaryensis]AOP34452.1 hypothetical protein A0128_11690 [Leptospira tipperaryensis]